jgi:hypothetical protein
VLLSPKIFFFEKDFLWTMDRDRNGQDGRNGQKWTAEWTMDNGRWTMDSSGEHSGIERQTSITTGTVALLFKPHALPSVEATTPIKNFRAFSCLFVVKK